MPRGTSNTQKQSTSERTPLTDEEKAERRAASNFVGVVGQVWEGDVRVNWISEPQPSNYGPEERYLFLLGDENRNAIRLWHSGLTFKQPNGLGGMLSVGDRVTIRATVKKQVEYKGEKQTELSKPLIVGVA
jgi:hypothetical protein